MYFGSVKKARHVVLNPLKTFFACLKLVFVSASLLFRNRKHSSYQKCIFIAAQAMLHQKGGGGVAALHIATKIYSFISLGPFMVLLLSGKAHAIESGGGGGYRNYTTSFYFTTLTLDSTDMQFLDPLPLSQRIPVNPGLQMH